MLAAMREFASGEETVARIVAEAALPVCAAVLAHRHGEHERAVDLMRPALDRMHELGGSHAQQDVLQQLFVDSAAKAGRSEDLRAMLARAARGRSAASEQRVGYAAAARSGAH
jgi:hypothetical protein